jgi:hypothetical protein
MNSVLVYIAHDADEVLPGRFWAAEAPGIWGRAYEFINLLTPCLEACMGEVTSRVFLPLQNERDRLKSCFLKGCDLLLSWVMPTAGRVGCGRQHSNLIWANAARGLACLSAVGPDDPGFASINPFGWLMQALGPAIGSVRIAFVLVAVLIRGFIMVERTWRAGQPHF